MGLWERGRYEIEGRKCQLGGGGELCVDFCVRFDKYAVLIG
jgi:hypothetical protein